MDGCFIPAASFPGVLAYISVNDKKLDRRALLRILGMSGLAAPFASGLTPLLEMNTAQAATNNPHRFLTIFLNGGWDHTLATNPAIGSKAVVGKFDRAYWDTSYGSYIGGNDYQIGGSINADLKVGQGFGWNLGSVNPFLHVPTTFVNGIFVEVTAHELAVNYLYSGKLSLSRSKEFPAIVATMADKIGGFPAHVLLGGPIPLSETKKTNPPLQAASMDMLQMMLGGPKTPEWAGDMVLSDAAIDSSHGLLDLLNNQYFAKRLKNQKDSLTSWNNAEDGIADFYAQNFKSKMDISALKASYGFTDDTSFQAKFAGAFRSIESNISRFITINGGNFDSHQNHVGAHIPAMQTVATVLHQLIEDLRSTDDSHPGAQPGDKLIDNTTILITSEFNRTPLFNSAGGTDHWPTGSAILMGRGVKPNTVYGSTSDLGYANNQAGNTVITSSKDAGVLLPDHLSSAILRHMGFNEEADELTEEDISGSLFTTS